VRALLEWAGQTPAFTVALVLLAAYPTISAIGWIVTALTYRANRERDLEPRERDDILPGQAARDFYDIADADLPHVSVLVPAFNEEAVLDESLASLHAVDYPSFEVIVIDDGSTDATASITRRHLAVDDRFRLVRKVLNEGKAMAMNDALAVAQGEVIVVVDADARLRPDALRAIAAHFVRLPRVGAVTGNPRVRNRSTLLSDLQALEFTAIVSVLRRAQTVWGRIMTVSGVISAFRASALDDVGGFDPSMATEDIELSWRLQRRFYDIRYEPRALIDMAVPTTFSGLWHQRRRWASGLAQVLRRHGDVLLHWRNRRHWPVAVEAICSVAWAHLFVLMCAFWLACLAVGAPPRGASPFPNGWGMVIATLCIGQIACGVALDLRYDRTILRRLWLAPLYPVAYWAIMALVTVRSTWRPLLLGRRPAVTRWQTSRAGA
jgi:poly-beta-1,6-N-acetyl-D-glucosamine synthase